MLGRHGADQTAAAEGLLAQQRHLRAHDEVTVQQTAQADQHDGRVRGEVTDLVAAALARRDHHAVTARLHLGAPALLHQQRTHTLQRGGRRFGDQGLALVRKGLQRLLAQVLLVLFPVGDDLGQVARDAQAGAQHQKGQDQQEPRRAVDGVQVDARKHVGPEGTELVDVVVQRFVLLDHGADHRSDADHREQRDRKAHRGEQLDHVAHAARTDRHLDAGGGKSHQSIIGRRPCARAGGRPFHRGKNGNRCQSVSAGRRRSRPRP